MGLTKTQRKIETGSRVCQAPTRNSPSLEDLAWALEKIVVYFNKICIYLVLLERTFQERHTLTSSSYWSFGIKLYQFLV